MKSEASKVIDFLARQRAKAHELVDETAADLQTSPGERTSQHMEREQIADMVAASEARNETKIEKVMGEVRAEFAGLRGDMKALDAKVSALPGRWELLAFSIATAIALFAAILGALAYGGDRFGAGADASAMVDAAVAKAVAAQAAATSPPK